MQVTDQSQNTHYWQVIVVTKVVVKQPKVQSS